MLLTKSPQLWSRRLEPSPHPTLRVHVHGTMVCQHTQLCCQHPLYVAQALPHCARVGVLVPFKLKHCHHTPRTIVPVLVVLLVYEHDVTAGPLSRSARNPCNYRCGSLVLGSRPPRPRTASVHRHTEVSAGRWLCLGVASHRTGRSSVQLPN